MMFRPTRIVRVTSRQELDSALGSADQLIVEGDEGLLSYAVAKASSDPQNRIAIELEGKPEDPFFADTVRTDHRLSPRIVRPEADRWASSPPAYSPAPAPTPAPLPPAPSAAPPRAGPSVPADEGVFARRAKSRRWLIVVICAVLVLLLAGAVGWYLAPGTATHPAPATAPSPAVPAHPAPAESPSAPEAPPSPPIDITAILQTLAWPLVSIVAILALFFVARQAIMGGRNVEISWKVTEKVTGRVVITKVRAPSARTRTAG